MCTATTSRAMAGVVACVLFAAGGALAAADRPVSWFRAGGGELARELEAGARRGLRLAAVSDGLRCSVGVLQGPATGTARVEYRVVADRDLGGALDGLTREGYEPVAATRVIGARHDIVFERATPPRVSGAWRLLEFEKLEDLPAALTSAAAEGYRARLLARPAFRSWPGLSQKGLLLVVKAPEEAPRDSRVIVATRKNVDDLTREVAAATGAGWQFDLLFAHTRDGGADGRRERAAVLLSKPRAGGAASSPVVTVERRASFGLVGDVVLGAAAYWDEYLFATVDRDRHQAWASPTTVGAGDTDCGPLGLGFRFDAPRDETSDIVALVARPRPTGGVELVVVTNQRIGF